VKAIVVFTLSVLYEIDDLFPWNCTVISCNKYEPAM